MSQQARIKNVDTDTHFSSFWNCRQIVTIPIGQLAVDSQLDQIYCETDNADLVRSLDEQGQLVPLIVERTGKQYLIISGARRFRAAQELGWQQLQAVICEFMDPHARQWVMLAANQSRQKRFSELMREADLLESLYRNEAKTRSLANLKKSQNLKIYTETECRNSDTPEKRDQTAPKGTKRRPQRTDSQVAKAIGIGGKDLYRQARAIWNACLDQDPRAIASVKELDHGTRTIHNAFKDLRRRNHLAEDFQPTPYDVWLFKTDRAYGITYPGAIPAGIIANTIHYFSEPGDLVVDPMAGGGTTLDVCQSLNRRCLAYDIEPSRADIRRCDIASETLPTEASNCDLIFLDPPYHTMLRSLYANKSVSSLDISEWSTVMSEIFHKFYVLLRPGGYLAVLIANQTEKDIPQGQGYIDHVLECLLLLRNEGFQQYRRISCPMQGSFRPHQITESRNRKRMLGQVRDLLVVKKPSLS